MEAATEKGQKGRKRDMCREEKTSGAMVKVEVNVTEIVKYVCLTGVLIVGIIFGCNAWSNAVKGKTGSFAE